LAKAQEQGLGLLAYQLVPHVLILMLLNDLCLVKLEHGFEEHEFKLFVAALFLQVLRDQHMVSLEPLIAKFDCLFRVHPYEVANVFGDQLLH
jgi:hypothetical protein